MAQYLIGADSLVHNGVAYYTHAASQWHKAAYFKPAIENGKVTFYIANPQGLKISTTVYGYYHGHLAETFLNHFDEDFTTAICTAKPVAGDSVAD